MSPAPICGAIKPVYAGGSAWLLLFQGGSPVAICFLENRKGAFGAIASIGDKTVWSGGLRRV